MNQMKEKLLNAGYKERTVDSVLTAQKLDKFSRPLFARHVKLLDKRVAFKYRRSLPKNASFLCLSEEPKDPTALPNISKCVFSVDELMFDVNGDLIGRLKPFSDNDEQAIALLNNPEFFDLLKFKPVFKKVDNWTSISGLYLAVS